MKYKRATSTVIIAALIAAFSYLTVELKKAFDEFTHWKSREAVLEMELQELKTEARKHKEFLDRLRKDPEYQESVARKELGYGRAEERLYRFPKEDRDNRINSNKP